MDHFFLLRIHQAQYHNTHPACIARAQHLHSPGWDRSLTEQPWAVSWLLEDSQNQPKLSDKNTHSVEEPCLCHIQLPADPWRSCYWFIPLSAQHPASPDQASRNRNETKANYTLSLGCHLKTDNCGCGPQGRMGTVTVLPMIDQLLSMLFRSAGVSTALGCRMSYDDAFSKWDSRSLLNQFKSVLKYQKRRLHLPFQCLPVFTFTLFIFIIQSY